MRLALALRIIRESNHIGMAKQIIPRIPEAEKSSSKFYNEDKIIKAPAKPITKSHTEACNPAGVEIIPEIVLYVGL